MPILEADKATSLSKTESFLEGIPESLVPLRNTTLETCLAFPHLWNKGDFSVTCMTFPSLFCLSTSCFKSSISTQQSQNYTPRDSQEDSMEMLAHMELQKYHPRTTYLFPPLATIGDLVWSNTQVSQHFSDTPGIHTTVGSHVGLTAPVNIHLADCKETRRRGFQRVMA